MLEIAGGKYIFGNLFLILRLFNNFSLFYFFFLESLL